MMQNAVRSSAICLWLGLAFACASLQPQRTRGPEGCYALRFADWQSPAYYQPPETIRLHPTPIEPPMDSYGWKLLSPQLAEFRTRPSFYPPMWRSRGDSLRLVWSDGFSGLVVRLDASGDSLSGTAVMFDDVVEDGQTDPTTSAVAVRRACPQSDPSPQ